MAAKQVLGTTELLEFILGELSCTRLLQVQLVCKKWNQVVRASKPLAEATFRRAVAPVLQAYLDTASQTLLDNNRNVNPNELLSGHRNTFTRFASGKDDRLATVPVVNPFLGLLWQRCGSQAVIKLTCVNGIASQAHSTRDDIHISRLSLQQQGTPSWEGMLLTQPPTRRVTILNRSETSHEGPSTFEASLLTPFTWTYTHPRHTHVVNDGGVTLGGIVSHLRQVFGGGSIEIMIEPLSSMLGSYWRQVEVENITAASLSTFIRHFDWASTDDSPVGWYPVDDGVCHLGGPLHDQNDPQRLDGEREAAYYRVFAGRRGGIGVINGKPVFGPERPPRGM